MTDVTIISPTPVLFLILSIHRCAIVEQVGTFKTYSVSRIELYWCQFIAFLSLLSKGPQGHRWMERNACTSDFYKYTARILRSERVQLKLEGNFTTHTFEPHSTLSSGNPFMGLLATEDLGLPGSLGTARRFVPRSSIVRIRRRRTSTTPPALRCRQTSKGCKAHSESCIIDMNFGCFSIICWSRLVDEIIFHLLRDLMPKSVQEMLRIWEPFLFILRANRECHDFL